MTSNATTGRAPAKHTGAETSLAGDAAGMAQAFSELVRVIQFRDRDLACCYGLTVSQCYGLKAVSDAGSMSVNELAAALYLEKSTASRLAAALEESGLVARTRDPQDQRSVRLTATAAGRRAYRAIQGALQQEYAELLRDFDPKVRSAMTELMGRLTRAVASRVEAGRGTCCVIR